MTQIARCVWGLLLPEMDRSRFSFDPVLIAFNLYQDYRCA